MFGLPGSRGAGTLTSRLKAAICIGAYAGMRKWKPSHVDLPRLVSAAQQWAATARHPSTHDRRLTHSREVVRRLVGFDLYTVASVRDTLAHNKRRRPPPVQVPHMTFEQYRAVRRRASRDVRAAIDVVWCTLARPSDWLGSADVGRPPVRLREVTMLPPPNVEALYIRTKPDQEGLGRRLRFTLPRSTWKWLWQRMASNPPSAPALPITHAQLAAAFRPFPLRSVRRGTIRLALLQGVPASRVMSITGHKDQATVLRYAGLMCPRKARHSLAVSAAVLRPLPMFRASVNQFQR